MRIDRTRDGGALGRLNQFREERGLPKLDKNGRPIKTKAAKSKSKTQSKAKKPASHPKDPRKIPEGGLKGRQHWFQSNFGNRG
jgi:hypothetical protein